MVHTAKMYVFIPETLTISKTEAYVGCSRKGEKSGRGFQKGNTTDDHAEIEKSGV